MARRLTQRPLNHFLPLMWKARLFPCIALLSWALLGVLTDSALAVQIPGPQFPKTLETLLKQRPEKPQPVVGQPVGFQRAPLDARQPLVTRSPAVPSIDSETYRPAESYLPNSAPIEPLRSAEPVPGFRSFNASNVYQKPAPVEPDENDAVPTLDDRSRYRPPTRPLPVIAEPVSRKPDSASPQLERPSASRAETNHPQASARPQSSRDPVSVFQPNPKQRRASIIENLSDSPDLTLARPRGQKATAMIGDQRQLGSATEPSAAGPTNQLAESANRLKLPPTADSMKVRVLAPDVMLEGQPNELTIEVLNLSTVASKPVKVQIQIPDSLTITRFDRDAWLDEKARTVTFSVDSIPGRYKQTIRLRGVSHQQGQHTLQVALVAEDQLLDRSSLALGVTNEASLMRNATRNDLREKPQQLNR